MGEPGRSRVRISMLPEIYCKDKRESRDIIVHAIYFNFEVWKKCVARIFLFFNTIDFNF